VGVISIVKLDQSGTAKKLEFTLEVPKGSTNETIAVAILHQWLFYRQHFSFSYTEIK